MSARETRGSLDSLRRLSDEELARVAAGGDEAAARVLLERFEEPLYRYTVALVRDPDLAREATWSALFEAARAVRVDDYSEPVRPWLFRVAHTAADVAGGRPNGVVENDEAAVRAAAAGGEDRERLEPLLAGIDALPDRERESLLLRELVGLEYTGIATVTGARASAARQAVFRARLALQEHPDAVTEHCDEIRAAMSKAEADVRERRSIATHLDTCAVCEEFARQLETRPADLRTLFPAPEEPLAAELVPPLPPVPAGARPDATDATAPITPVEEDRGDRDRRRPLAVLALAVVLVGAGIATALALNDNGGGEKGKARAARESSAASTAQQRTSSAAAEKNKAAAAEKRKRAAAAEKKQRAAAAEKQKKAEAEKTQRAAAAEKQKKAAAAEKQKAAAAEKRKRAAAAEKAKESKASAASAARAKAGSGEASASSSAQAQSGAEAGTAAGRTVPRTGLDVSLIVALGFLMLALGVSLRRIYAEL